MSDDQVISDRPVLITQPLTKWDRWEEVMSDVVCAYLCPVQHSSTILQGKGTDIVKKEAANPPK